MARPWFSALMSGTFETQRPDWLKRAPQCKSPTLRNWKASWSGFWGIQRSGSAWAAERGSSCVPSKERPNVRWQVWTACSAPGIGPVKWPDPQLPNLGPESGDHDPRTSRAARPAGREIDSLAVTTIGGNEAIAIGLTRNTIPGFRPASGQGLVEFRSL